MKQYIAMVLENGLVNLRTLAESVALALVGHGLLLASVNVSSIFNLLIQSGTMTGLLEFALQSFEQTVLFSYPKHSKITNLTCESLYQVCLITKSCTNYEKKNGCFQFSCHLTTNISLKRMDFAIKTQQTMPANRKNFSLLKEKWRI